jgi:uncharacterized protein YjbI with pentapeptide repeats
MIRAILKQLSLAPLFALVILLVPAQLQAQADLSLSIKPAANGQLQLSWPVKSLVPAPGRAVFADYQVAISTDLKTWTNFGEVIPGTNFANKTITFTLKDDGPVDFDPGHFFKLQSLMDFSGADFILLILSKANFEKGTFIGTDFFSSNLQQANFTGANLEAADLRQADLSGATLARSKLLGASLANANLTSVDASFADLSFADFSETTLDNADLSGADLRFTSFLGAAGRFVSLQQTTADENTLMDDKLSAVWQIVNGKAEGKDFSNRDLNLCDLRSGSFKNVNLSNADLRGSDFRLSDLSGANLATAQISLIDIRQTTIDAATQLSPKLRTVWNICNTDFSGQSLPNADLSSTLLVERKLTGANLQGVNFNLSTLELTDFSQANLKSANLSRADLFGANFENADLTSANFNFADLSEVSFKGANMTGAITNRAIFRNTTMPDGSIRP